MRLLVEAENRAIAVIDGFIDEPFGPFDHVIRVPNGEIRPGLINAHEHLHRNHYGRLGSSLYANAYQWAADIQKTHRGLITEGGRLPRRQALLRGAWKNLLAGVTHVVHHDSWEPDFESGFPLTVVKLPSADSLGMARELAHPLGQPFALHVAEGTDEIAAREIHDLAARGWLNPQFIAIHVVGPDPDGVTRLRNCGGAIVWCPSSNQFLFGRTTPAALLAEGMDVLLGTDSLLTGAGDLLDELRYARSLGLLSDARLLDAVGTTATCRLGMASPSLDVGAKANFAVLRKPLLEATAEDVALVFSAGELRVLDPALVPVRFPPGRIIKHRSVYRWISETAPF